MAKDEISQAELNLEILKTLKEIRSQAAAGTDVGDVLEKVTSTLEAVSTRTMPENREHTRISHFNPTGKRDHERPQLKCDMWWVGYPETPETLTDAEIEALNTLQPGHYFVTKGNGDRIAFTVTPRQNSIGKLERLEIMFPCKGDQSSDHRSKIEYIHEAMGAKVPSVSELMAELAKVKHELATAHAVIGAA